MNQRLNKRAAAVVVKDGKILLMRRVKNGREYFVFPGGGIHEGEAPEEAAARELEEEFGIGAKIEKLLFRVENRGREEFYFLVREFSGVPEIGGEEKGRMNADNQYYPAWKKLSEIPGLSNLYPEEARQKVEDMYGEYNS